MLQDAEYSTHANINRAGMQLYRYETFTATAAEKVHCFCGIKKKEQLRLQKRIREMTPAQRLDIYEVAGVKSDATHANDQRTANCVINTSVLSNRLESVCEETAPT